MSAREQRALAAVIAEERSLPPPELDWSRIEEGIVARTGRVREPPVRSRARIYAAVALAAAAGLALVGASLPRFGAPIAASSAAPGGARAPSTSTPGVESPGGPSGTDHVEHAGRAHWTLEPGSSARVRQSATAVVVELEAGGIDAEVEPGEAPASFVVEAGQVRVEVHGTQFRVERRGEQVDVSVWEGVVSVAARGEPQPVKVAAPASKRFVDGKLNAGVEGARARPSASDRAPGALPLEPNISEVEAGVSRILAAAQGCFARHISAHGVQVSVRTNALLSVRPDGVVVVHGFDPPLHPGVDGCTRAAIDGLRFAQSRRGIELTRSLELKR